MMNEEAQRAGWALSRAARTAERNPGNHLAVRQLVIELERHVAEGHQDYAALVPMFWRVNAGLQLPADQFETLLSVARFEAKNLRTGKE
jgi:hypothetical protein